MDTRKVLLAASLVLILPYGRFADALLPTEQINNILPGVLSASLNLLNATGLLRSASPPSGSCSNGSVAYTSVVGDLCSSIAAAANMAITELKSENPNLSCEPFSALPGGITICIPQGSTPVPSVPCSKTYIVLPGDDCDRIAAMHDLTQADFLALNPGLNCSAIENFNTICVANQNISGTYRAPDVYNSSTPSGEVLLQPIQQLTSAEVLEDLQAASVNSRQIDLLYAAFVQNHGGSVPGSYKGDTVDRRQVFNETVTSLTSILEYYAEYERLNPVDKPPPPGNETGIPIIITGSPGGNERNPSPQFGFTHFSTFTAGECEFLLGDRTSEALEASKVDSAEASNPYQLEFPYGDVEVESYVNWLSHIASDDNYYSYVTSVKDQGQCGSCWAFAAIGALESIRLIKTGFCPSLSEQQVLDCLVRQQDNLASTCFGFSTYQPYDPKKNKNQPYYQHVGGSCQTEEEEPDNTCNGGWIFAALQYASQFGIGSNKTYPYPQDEYNYGVPQDSGVCRVNPGYSYQPPTFSSVPLSRGQPDMLADNVYALMRAVTMQPVAVSINAQGTHQNEIFLLTGGIIYADMCKNQQTNHAVLIVGYDIGNLDASGAPLRKNGFWIIRNSWGGNWGSYPPFGTVKGATPPAMARGYFYVDMWGEKRTPSPGSGYQPERGPCGIYKNAFFPDIRDFED